MSSSSATTSTEQQPDASFSSGTIDWMMEIERSIGIVQHLGERLERERRQVVSVGHELMLIAQEAKLIKHVARIAYLNLVNAGQRRYPDMERWLTLVNVTPREATAIADCVTSIPELVQLNDNQLIQICDQCRLEVQSRRLFRKSTYNLRRYIQRWQADGTEPVRAFLEKELAWGSFDRLHSFPTTFPRCGGIGGDRRSASESGVDSGASDSGVGSNVSQNSLPTATPPASPLRLNAPGMEQQLYKAASSTPPPSGQPKRPAMTNGGMDSLASPSSSAPLTSASTTASMIRSHSHESHLQHSTEIASPVSSPAIPMSRSTTDCLSVSGIHPAYPQQQRGHTLSPPSPGAAIGGPVAVVPPGLQPRSPSTSTFGSLPKSPKSGRMIHSIPHVWHKRTAFRHLSDNCQVCQRPLGFVSVKCKSCKAKVHPQCTAKVGDTCGLTPGHLKAVLKEMMVSARGNAQDVWSDYGSSTSSAIAGSRSMNEMAFAYPDTNMVDSSSSTNSSAPSTPAPPLGLPSPYLQPPSSACVLRFPLTASGFGDQRVGSAASSGYASSAGPGGMQHFTYPDLVDVPNINVVNENGDDDMALIESQGSDYTIGGRSSDGTLLSDSQGSAETTTANFGSQENATGSGDDDPNSSMPGGPGGYEWKRKSWNMFTVRYGSSWSEVTIPFNKIEFGPNSLVGRGRFGEVHKGKYFGDVAVKLLNMDHVDEEQQVEMFKQEVVSFKNTRHENIILFLGYCIERQNLAIVMNFCKGRPLHLILHESLEKLDFSVVALYASQICQGVSYLHTKKILHKDLRTKNIFIESKGKVVITDFGLFNSKRLVQSDRPDVLCVPEYWLCYLAPELIKALSPSLGHLPFSEASDVYAFGTVWFELITGEFPFRRMSPEAVVWQVGRGMKPALDNIAAGREVKEVLAKCWKFDADKRPDFAALLKILDRLPKKRLIRSPSYPAQLSRSHESMF